MRLLILSLCFTSPLPLPFLSRSVTGSPFHQESDNHQLRMLLEARRDTLKRLVELVNMEVEGGHAVHTEQSAANLLLTEAELEVARSPAERIACFEKALEFYKEIERQVKARAEIGAVKAVDVLLVRAARLKAEVELKKISIDQHETTGKFGHDGTAEAPKTTDVEIKKLLDTRYETLKEAVSLIQFEVESGFGSTESLPRVSGLLLETFLELPNRPAEGIAILETILADNTKIEKRFHAYWKENNLYEKSFLLSKAAREEAALNLYRAKNAKSPESIGRNTPSASIAEEGPGKELQALLIEHRDTLKTLRRVVVKDGEVGVASIANMINANNAYVQAELELATSPQEHAASLQEALKMQKDVERIAQGRYETGTLREAEFLSAKAARLKAAIELQRALE